MTDREIMAHAKLVMVAGGGTSWRQMGITLFALLTHRDQFEEVKATARCSPMRSKKACAGTPLRPISTAW